MNPKNEVDEKTMKDYDWKGHIRDAFGDLCNTEWRMNFFSPCADTEEFLTSIWKMTTDVLEGKKIHVVIDNKDELYVNSGPSSFVLPIDTWEDWDDGESGDQLEGSEMQLPIKCWIHTMTLGDAYLSGDNWKTVRTWQPFMKSVVVLGDNQYLTLNMDNYREEKHTFQAKKVYFGLLTEDVKSVMDVDVYIDELEVKE